MIMKIRMSGKSFVEFLNVAPSDAFRPYQNGMTIDHEGNLWVTNGFLISVIGNAEVDHRGNTAKFHFVRTDFLKYIAKLIKSNDLVQYDTETCKLHVLTKDLIKDYREHFAVTEDYNAQIERYIESHSEKCLCINFLTQNIKSDTFETTLNFEGYKNGELPPFSKCIENLAPTESLRPFNPVYGMQCLQIVNTDFTNKKNYVNKYIAVNMQNFVGLVKFTRTDNLVTCFLSEVRL